MTLILDRPQGLRNEEKFHGKLLYASKRQSRKRQKRG